MPHVPQKQNQKIKSSNQGGGVSTPSSDIEFKVHFPEENPKDCIDDITDTMRHIGLFDGITK